jgi:hypothetical protein
VWPLSPRPEVVRGFELPPKPWLPGHRGVDLAGSPGQPVLSATAGKITYAGQLAGRGVIVVARGPIRTTYEPVVPSVHVGTTVTPGTELGRLSAAASHCAPATCLHWGLLQSTLYLNPLSLLPTQPLRLLPIAERSPAPAPHSSAPPPHSSAPPSTFAGTAPGFGTLLTAPTTQDHRAPAARVPSTPEPADTDQRASPASANQPTEHHTGSPAAPIVVGIAALITVGSALMTKRH